MEITPYYKYKFLRTFQELFKASLIIPKLLRKAGKKLETKYHYMVFFRISNHVFRIEGGLFGHFKPSRSVPRAQIDLETLFLLFFYDIFSVILAILA